MIKTKIKKGPCIDKNCSYCCDPVKVSSFFPERLIPKDSTGKVLWKEKGFLTSAGVVDGLKLKSYECLNFDKKSGLCKDYDNRPDICKNSSCIDENSDKSIDEQHKKMVEEKFIAIK